MHGPVVRIEDDTCVRAGGCVPACPHNAIDVVGDLARAIELASRGDAVLILTVEAAIHFHPATPEQVVNAAWAAGFASVHHGVQGDELVAAEYERILAEPDWGTMIRSTCPVIVEKIRHEYPELVPYLAPVATPLVAEARYLRELHGQDTALVYAGVCLAEAEGTVDAALTFQDLDTVFDARGVSIAHQPRHYTRIAGERRRHVSTSGGMPFSVLKEEPQVSRRFRKLRGLEHLDRLRAAVVDHRLDLGFVDLLPCEGCLDHPLLGPHEDLYRRRKMLEQTEPPRSALPVLDPSVNVPVGASYLVAKNGHHASEAEVDAVVRKIGLAPNGEPWNCGACGYKTCRAFGAAYLKGRTSYRQCPPYQELRADEARREATVDDLTGLSTYRVLMDRLRQELSRSQRSGDPFAVLFLDMDDFKRINDSFGHAAGSKVLAEVGDRLAEAVRATDTAARYGGDEFVILLIRTDLAGAVRVAEVVKDRVGALGSALGYASRSVTASLGVAAFDPSVKGGEDVLERADRALYRAKAAGGDRVAVSEEPVRLTNESESQ